jgi:hypothetical protein
MLLFLIKHLIPDIANIVRELSKRVGGANTAALKAKLRVVNFVLDNKLHCLKMESRGDLKECYLVAWCDMAWAGGAASRIGVTGFIIYYFAC